MQQLSGRISGAARAALVQGDQTSDFIGENLSSNIPGEAMRGRRISLLPRLMACSAS